MKINLYFCVIVIIIIIVSCNKKNDFDIKFDKNLDSKDFKIEVENFYAFSKKVIYEKGLLYEIPDGYGENDWTLTYKDSVFCTFRHFKTRENVKHSYFFNFSLKEDKICCHVKIIGLDKFDDNIVLDSIFLNINAN